jgi:hypothetical protein
VHIQALFGETILIEDIISIICEYIAPIPSKLSCLHVYLFEYQSNLFISGPDAPEYDFDNPAYDDQVYLLGDYNPVQEIYDYSDSDDDI